MQSPARRPNPSPSRSAEPLTEGGLEEPRLDGLLVVVLADYGNAVVTEHQPGAWRGGLLDRCKKWPAPLIELRQEFLGAQHRARRGMRLDPRRGADHDAGARHPNALPVAVRRRKRDGADGGAKAKILRHLEPPHRPLQRAGGTQHAICGIIDEHHRVTGFECRVLDLVFAFVELAAEVSRKMLADHRVAEHPRKAAEIALCRAFEDLALAPPIAVSDDVACMEGTNVVARRLGDDVVERGVDQVMTLSGQTYLGPVVFDIVRPAKDLDVLLLAVAAHDAQEPEAVQSAERVRVRSVELLCLKTDEVGFGDPLQRAPVQYVARDQPEQRPIRNIGQAAHLREIMPDDFAGGLIDRRPELFLGARAGRNLG